MLRSYESGSGFRVVRIHYTDDQEKNPATERGKEWFREATKGFPRGVESAQWQREMEINWEATGGDLVFPAFQAYRNKIAVAPFSIPEGWRLHASFDYGFRNPSSFHVYAIDYDSRLWAVWEYYKSGVGYREIARALRACEFWDRLSSLPIADPSIWALTQQGEQEVKSIGQLFAELPESEQVIFMPGKKGGDIAAAAKINGLFWSDLANQEPRFRIFSTCPMIIWELEKLRFADWSGSMQMQRNFREQIIDKDNHAFDDLKMFITQFYGSPEMLPQDPYEHLKKIDPVSYKEWTSIAKRREPKPSSNLGEFE